MKLFVVMVSVALVAMFIFATHTAAAPTDFEDVNDNINNMPSNSVPIGGISPYVRSSSSYDYTKISSKHPLYVLIKSVVKLLTKIFSAENSY